jgi:hypothetical protein
MAPSRKIGVLTFHRCINYGSYWQARCLVEGLRARGHEAILLDHASAGVNLAEWRCALQPLRPASVPKSDYPLYASKTRRFFKAFDGLPLSSPFDLDRPETVEPQDVVIVGSDEVWNLRHPWYGGRPIFYGEGLPAARLASYAASFGNQDAEEGLDPSWADKLERFDALSVRDENSRRLVRDALGREPELVLDPCLQFPPPLSSDEEREPYVAVYGHSFPDWFRREVRAFAASRGWPLVSIGYGNDWADERRIAVGPEEFARLMAGSAAVATNFFHGCVFALIGQKPFVCAPSDYRFNKVRDLARAVGADRHLVNESTDAHGYAELMAEPLDPAVADRIAALRRRSDRYLDHVLQ